MPRHLRHLVCIPAAITLAGTANAQETRSPVMDRADSRMQINAASLVPTLRGRWPYADHRLIVGRVQDVRVSANGNALIAVVACRRWLGEGRLASQFRTCIRSTMT
ncbi:hypothetical protein [Methylorubrum extorquens]|uniref:Uncharacterized protein n=1 Tax=Methylorubrum extorquens (strain CM4 / NCIMB 13688) TaxID=440085 RepID=B7KZW8_METC4|nr:hypothetical protein [Methylorubrum extorquens]ACK84899.1 conserved hypothetical protein [Methylorubrum extorquens CM4]